MGERPLSPRFASAGELQAVLGVSTDCLRKRAGSRAGRQLGEGLKVRVSPRGLTGAPAAYVEAARPMMTV